MLALAAGSAPPEPGGYRLGAYRAPVPATVAGRPGLDVGQAEAMWRAGAGFLDVMPRPERPEGLPEGTLWRDRPRETIPGAVWAPNTGYGRLSPAAEAYLRDALAALRAGEPDRAIVVFCETDCWMSWNVARRAILEHGLAGVRWFPGGTDAWRAAGLPLERAEPFPRP